MGRLIHVFLVYSDYGGKSAQTLFCQMSNFCCKEEKPYTMSYFIHIYFWNSNTVQDRQVNEST